MYGDLILNVTATLKREETDDEYNTRLQNIIKVKNFKKIIKSLKL
jgi:non-homologous end joining protein Ku